MNIHVEFDRVDRVNNISGGGGIKSAKSIHMSMKNKGYPPSLPPSL